MGEDIARSMAGRWGDHGMVEEFGRSASCNTPISSWPSPATSGHRGGAPGHAADRGRHVRGFMTIARSGREQAAKLANVGRQAKGAGVFRTQGRRGMVAG